MTNRIDTRLAKAAAEGRPALAPFLTVGFPDVETSTRIAGALLDAGADVLELGVPFSDPLAEGPTIQRSSLHALRQGVTFDTCLKAVADVRLHDDDGGLLLMGYYNPLLRYGLADAAGAASDAGCDGFIVPDLPAEECGPFAQQCRRRGLHLIPLLAPTSTEERIALACEQAGGFIYCVSVAGVTGARADVHGGVRGLVERIRPPYGPAHPGGFRHIEARACLRGRPVRRRGRGRERPDRYYRECDRRPRRPRRQNSRPA